jgi:hypothetical protein
MSSNKSRTPWNKGKTGYKVKRTEEHNRKIGEANIGKHHKLDYKHTEEAKQKISEANKGNTYWLGHKHKEESKRKIGDANRKRKGKQIPWNKGVTGYKTKPCSDEQRKVLSELHMGMHAGDKNPNWNGGSSFEPYCSKFNDKLRKRIRDRDDHTCQLCGMKEDGRKLSIHHIHYDKPNCNPDLIALCTGCNGRANVNRDYYESLFMQKLKERGLLTE